MEKTKYSFFHKPSEKDDIPLCLPKLVINNYEIQRKESIKFLGVLLDQNLTWKEPIKLTENKIAKSIGILYKARPSLDKKALLCFYAVVQWLSLLHNLIQLSLNSGSAQVQTLLAACRRYAMVRISDNGPGWK